MKLIKSTISQVEATYDPSVVKLDGEFYVVMNQLGPNLTLALRSEYDLSINNTIDNILSTDKFIQSLKEST